MRLCGVQAGHHHRVCPLAQQQQPALGRAHHHRHTLAFAGELQHAQQLVRLRLTLHAHVQHALLAPQELKPVVCRHPHQRAFIGGGGRVHALPAALVRQHRVAQRQHAEEHAAALAVPARHLQRSHQPVVPHGVIHKVVVAAVPRAALAFRLPPVHRAADGALAEHHAVLRQRACLVGEDVLHHAQLLVEVGGARQHGPVRGRVVHVQVVLEELGLDDARELRADVQG
mmetsp:Transcript_7012/g.17727  ORF Transcript_7012/g.17727 Transcript_7012/m.17727 type:complete len:228 (-) Transcript_7012:1022-1705(-)